MADRQDEGELASLPQRFDVWQVDARQAAATLRAGERAVQPWVTLAVSQSDGHVLAFELSPEAPDVSGVRATLVKALREPVTGEPHRPTEVQVREPAWVEALGPWLQALGVACVTAETLDQADGVFAELGGLLPAEAQPGLLDMPGVAPDGVASFFDAAALFYGQAPWKRAGERPIRVECAKFESGPWFVVTMGRGGMARGLMLYDDLETLQRVAAGDLPEEESARLTSALVVGYGPEADLSEADAQAVKQHGWPVAGPQAYPSVYRLEPGLSMRPPLAWELELLEGCLRAIPEFLRKKTRRLGPLELAVPVASGELGLVLSWAAGP